MNSDTPMFPRSPLLPRRDWRRPLFFVACLLLFPDTALWAAEAGADAGVEQETMFSLIKKGGWVMIPLFIASIIALAIAVERFISLRRDRVLPSGFLNGLGEAWHADPSGQLAEQFCNRSGGAVGHVFKAGIQWREYGYEAVNRAIEDAGSREAGRMKRSLRGLSAVAAVCPLLGLLGTVYGMIDAFQRTSVSGGAAKTQDLAVGIYEALVTTATGLTIAIPVMLVYQYLASRVDGLIDYVDEVGTSFIVEHARLEIPPAEPPELEVQPVIAEPTEAEL